MASVNNGVTSNNVVLNAEDMFVFSGGIANNTTVNEDSYVFVSKGGTINSTTVNDGGEVDVLSSGIATNTLITKGGYMLLEEERAKAIDTTVNAGFFTVNSGGTASNTTVNDGGSLYVCESGNIKGTTIVNQGGRATFEGGVFTGIAVHGGTLKLKMDADPEALNCYFDKITIDSDGSMTISAGASASSATINKGAVTVRKDGILENATLTSATVVVSNGAIASRVDLKDDAVMNVMPGGNIKRIYVSAGAVLTGVLHDAPEILRFYGGTLDLNISDAAPDGDSLISDVFFSTINGSYNCTLTVKNDQTNGSYKLIEGATSFDGTITVKNTAGKSLGTISIGETVNINGSGYTLNLGGDNALSVTVGAAVQAPVRGDRDGNGVSDVMFVWTGSNHAHGYWMNGSADWWSYSVGVDAAWDNLGSYDMNMDGKADAVMVGNVVTEAGKGAYIGFYNAGNDVDGWVNIGYLPNAEDIDWSNMVGNLTGTAGANSIVWYAPELYALGAWIDGTDTWVGISAGFGGPDWTLAGCGDFNGDGKDDILMMYGGCMFYSVDIDGNFASLGASAWYNCEVRAIGDFAGDGKDDIVIFDKTSGGMYMLRDGNADDFAVIGQLDPGDWFVAGCGDYNADGKDDLLVRQNSTGMLGYYASGVQANWNVMGYGVDMQWTVIA